MCSVQQGCMSDTGLIPIKIKIKPGCCKAVDITSRDINRRTVFWGYSFMGGSASSTYCPWCPSLHTQRMPIPLPTVALHQFRAGSQSQSQSSMIAHDPTLLIHVFCIC